MSLFGAARVNHFQFKPHLSRISSSRYSLTGSAIRRANCSAWTIRNWKIHTSHSHCPRLARHSPPNNSDCLSIAAAGTLALGQRYRQRPAWLHTQGREHRGGRCSASQETAESCGSAHVVRTSSLSTEWWTASTSRSCASVG